MTRGIARSARVALVVSIVFTAGCGGCKGGSGGKSTGGAGALDDPRAEPLDAVDAAQDASTPLPPRCTDRQPLPLAPGTYEMGDALVTAERIFVGLSHDVDKKRRAALLTVTRDGARLSIASVVDDAAELAADAPPPKVVLLGGKPLLALYPRTEGTAKRELAIDAWRIPQQSDMSFAFDVAARGAEGIVAWDEDAPNAARGLVKVVPLPYDAAAPVKVVSADTSDADSPRVAARPGGGFVIAWLARKPETERDAQPELEGPAEKRQHVWLEIAEVDAKGTLTAQPVRVTKAGSRVESFDLLAHDDAVDILVKDDEQPGDDEGSRLVLVTLRGAETLVRVIAERGVGRGIPDLLAGQAMFADVADRARLLPLAPGARVSPEPDLDRARPLAALGDQILAGFPGDSAKPLAVFRCFEPVRKQ